MKVWSFQTVIGIQHSYDSDDVNQRPYRLDQFYQRLRLSQKETLTAYVSTLRSSSYLSGIAPNTLPTSAPSAVNCYIQALDRLLVNSNRSELKPH